MINFKIIISILLTAIFLHGCARILEPVSIMTSGNNVVKNAQQEFPINIKALTFKSAHIANLDAYSRQLMITGSGSRANLVDEANYLNSNIPSHLQSTEYKLGIGDELSFTHLYEYNVKNIDLPINRKKNEYKLGIGDELTFVQLFDTAGSFFDIINNGDIQNIENNSDKFISTSGTIGSNGNILLLGVGNIQAENKSLSQLQTDIRNILIRNGQAPNFQLEITDFRSKKAYISVIQNDNIISKSIIPINNISVSLQEMALRSGLTKTVKNQSIAKLTRDKTEYVISALQLFDIETPKIIIQNDDEIEFITNNQYVNIKNVSVGSKGNILIPKIGSIKVVNKTINEVDKEIHKILTNQRLVPKFQLELANTRSSKAFLIKKSDSSNVISLSNINLPLKEILLANQSLSKKNGQISVITLKRHKEIYRLTEDKILDPDTPDIWLQGGDLIEVDDLSYKPGQVYALNGSGDATIVEIDPSKRETLADIMFVDKGALNNINLKRSEIYLLRGRDPSTAYHLNAESASRILVAAKTELRPNDIIYVADRPIISFNRLLSEFLPLRLLLRDISEDNIP